MTEHYPDPNTARLALYLLCTVVFFAVVNGNMVNVALPFIGQHFEVTEGTYGWLVTGFSLTFAIFSAVHGRLANRVGLRRLYAMGVIVLGGLSLLLAFAPTIELAIAMRIFQGAGSAALPAMGTVVIARLFPPERRGEAMGMILASVGVAASIGPFLGGLLVELGGWRLVFAATGLVLFALPFIFRLLPESLDETYKEPFDTLGAVLLTGGASALLYSFNVIERLGPGWEFFSLLAGGLFLLLVLWWRISRIEDPFVDPKLFADFRFVVNSAVAFLVNATRFGTIVLVPIFLIEVNQVSPLVVGIVLLPGALFIAFLSTPAGRVADNYGARRPVAVGAILVIAGNIITALTAGISVLGSAIGMGLYGLGFALIQSPIVSATSQILSRRHGGPGMGIFMMIFFLGGAFGVALSVTVVEIQSPETAAWFGSQVGGGALYSNAIFSLTFLAIIALLLTPKVPGYRPLPPDEYEFQEN